MKRIKIIVSLILAMCLTFCAVGCGQSDEFEDFDPIGVRIVENAAGAQYETNIDDKEITQKLWNRFIDLDIDDEEEGEIGSAYIYLCFYDDSETTLGVFTIYENGSCCLGEDFDTFYVVDDGVQVYIDLCDIYTEYTNNNEKETA